MGLSFDIGKAQASHTPELARLLIQASGGVIDALYAGLMGEKETWRIVESRFHRPHTSGHFTNCFVARQGETILGALHAHPMADLATDPPDRVIPKNRYWVAQPFYHLDPAAEGSFHVHFVSVFEPYRGQGVGTALIETACNEATRRGFPVLSLTVFEQNERAVALYERFGFGEVARHPAARHPAIGYGGHLLMMLAPLDIANPSLKP